MLDRNLAHPSEEVQGAAAKALSAFAHVYYYLQPPAQKGKAAPAEPIQAGPAVDVAWEKALQHYLQRLSKGTSCAGESMLLGLLSHPILLYSPFKGLPPAQYPALQAIVSALGANCDVAQQTDALTRRNAARSLARVILVCFYSKLWFLCS